MSTETIFWIVAIFIGLVVIGQIGLQAQEFGKRHAERTGQDPKEVADRFNRRAVMTCLWIILGAAVYSKYFSDGEPPKEAKSAPEAEPKITIKAAGFTEDDVKATIAAFRKACMPLGGNKMWSEIKEIRADLFEEYARYRLDRGWKNTLHLQLALSDELKNIPTYDPQTGVMSGHVLHYFLGGGKTPGFFSQKRVSAYLCGQPVDQSGADVFSSVPEMTVLNGKQ